MRPIRVLLADDHPVVRAGLRAVLATEDGLQVVAEVATAEEAVARRTAGDVDVVLMDLQFAGSMGGVEATGLITAQDGAPRVVVLTTYETEADILAAIESGASGYLLKDADPQALSGAVREAAVGRSALAPRVADRLVDLVRSPVPALSAREAQVLGLVAAGLSNRDIARRLVVSEATVKSHLVHVFAKLGVDSRTAAVAVATERGVIR